jgi:wyosine [tRNA(Phe)-imidazoG37] synthetase (radical SAM superfamily)
MQSELILDPATSVEILEQYKPRQPKRPPVLKTSLPVRGPSRSYFGNRFIYTVISQRARGLSIGINLNPDKFCNFDCVYCEVDRRQIPPDASIDLDALTSELRQMLTRAYSGTMRELPGYAYVPDELLQLKEVAVSGDGEPTLSPCFAEVMQAVVHVRAQGAFPFFKLVVITNATGLHLTQVQEGLKLLTREDEIWVKLEAGTQAAFEQINRPKNSPLNCPEVTLALVMENILALGKQRPVVIQSLFPLIDGQGPTANDIEEYTQRLKELKDAGAQISLVQIYSAHRPAARTNCGHLPLRTLSQIAQRVRQVTGLRVEVF